MANYCPKCGGMLIGTKQFCPHCGAQVSVPQNPAPNIPQQNVPMQQPYQQQVQQQPAQQRTGQQPVYQQNQPQQQIQPVQQKKQPSGQKTTQKKQKQQPAQPQRPAQPAQVKQPKPKKKGKAGLVIGIVAGVLVLALGVTAFFAFREGGFLRRTNGKEQTASTASNSEAMLEYAKKLEKMGNPEAAAAVYAKIRQSGGAELKEAADQHRDDPEWVMLEALSGEDLYRTLSGEKKTPEMRFTDVREGSEYYEAALWAQEEHFIVGDTFQPMKAITRAELVTYLWRAKGRPQPESMECPYEDVDKDAVYYTAVLWALEKGLFSSPEKGLKLEDTANRGQAVTFLYRIEKTPETAYEQIFDDVKEGAYYALPAVWAAQQGALAAEGSFRPKDPCTRAEFFMMLKNLYG